MLGSIYLKTLRDLRKGIIGWGIGMGLLVVVHGMGFVRNYPDEAARLRLTEQIRGGLSVTQALYGELHDAQRIEGFLEWRVLGLAPVLLGLYLILATTGMTRGAEESHAIEVVAATAETRSRLVIEQAAALATALAAALAIMGGLTLATAAIARQAIPDLVRVAGAYANVGAATLFFGALGPLAAQVLASRRSAALAAAGAMILFHLANTLPLAVPGIHGVRYISPLYLYTRSSPLADGHMDWRAWLGLVFAAALAAGLALVAAQRRDFFDTYHLRQSRQRTSRAGRRKQRGPARPELFLRNGLTRGLRDASGGTLAWAAGMTIVAVVLTALTPNMREAVMEQSNEEALRLLGTTDRAILSALLTVLLPPIVTAFGVTLAAAWAGDELGQRLELELSVPVSRWKTFLLRLLAAVGSEAVLILVVGVAIVITIELGGVKVPILAVAAAATGLLVLSIVILAVAFAVAGWKPELAVVTAGTFVAVSYFGSLAVPSLGLPDWVRYLSPFGLHGAPLAEGMSLWKTGVLMAFAVALAALGLFGFQRRDIAK